MVLDTSLYWFGVGVYNSTLYIFNGQPATNIESRASFDYNLSGNVSWTMQNIPDFYFENHSSPVSIRMYGQSVLQIGDIVYCLFPNTADLQHKTMLKYSLISHSYFDTNTYQATRDASRSYASCVTFNSKLNVIYSLGIKYTEYYNISNDSWAYFLDPKQMARYSGCAMDINSAFIFKFGGYDDSYYDIIEMYDVGDNSWAIVPNVTLKQNMSRLECLLYANVVNKIYCTGGYVGDEYLSDVHVFDTQSLTIDYVTYELNIALIGHRMILFNNCLFVIGGYNGIITLDSIEYLCLNKITDSPSSSVPSMFPTQSTNYPSIFPSKIPTYYPTFLPSISPSKIPTYYPTSLPSISPSKIPTNYPTSLPSISPSKIPTNYPTSIPSIPPSKSPVMTTVAPNVHTNSAYVSMTLIVIIAVGVFVCFCAIVIACVCMVWQRRIPKTSVIRTPGYEYPKVELELTDIQTNAQFPTIPEYIPHTPVTIDSSYNRNF